MAENRKVAKIAPEVENRKVTKMAPGAPTMCAIDHGKPIGVTNGPRGREQESHENGTGAQKTVVRSQPNRLFLGSFYGTTMRLRNDPSD